MSTAVTAAAPVWPLLAVAGITVTGTLGATVLTLLWSARREGRRWERERQDRHEIDRKQDYARLIAALHSWYSALVSVAAGRTTARLTGEQPDTSEARRQHDAVREVVAMVDFVAPPNVRKLAWQALRSGEMFYVELTGPEPADDATKQAAARRFRDARTALSNAMREDLGLQPGTEVVERPKRT